MARASWSVPVIIGAVGLAWVAFLGFDIWASPDAGRPTEAELTTALTQAVSSRDESGLQQLFSGPDLPSGYARDYLAQVPASARVSAAASRDATGPLITLRASTPEGLRCTTWRVRSGGGRVSLSATPTLSAPCGA